MRQSNGDQSQGCGQPYGTILAALVLAGGLGGAVGHAEPSVDFAAQVDTGGMTVDLSEASQVHKEVEELQNRSENEVSVWEIAVETCGRENVRSVNVEYSRDGQVLKSGFKCGKCENEEENTVQDD